MERGIQVRERETRFVVVCCTMGGLLFGAAVPNADASNFGSGGTPGITGTNNGVWLIPDSYFVIAKRSLSPAAEASVDNAYLALNLSSDIIGYTDTYGSSCATQIAEQIYESCFFDLDYGNNNFLGWNACYDSVSGTDPNQVCALAWTRLNTFYSASGSLSQYNACHEMGHSIGLRHSSEAASCMMTAITGGSSATLSVHDYNHVNAQY